MGLGILLLIIAFGFYKIIEHCVKKNDYIYGEADTNYSRDRDLLLYLSLHLTTENKEIFYATLTDFNNKYKDNEPCFNQDCQHIQDLAKRTLKYSFFDVKDFQLN